MKRASGFTLIELLVAITILAIVAVLGWRGLDGIIRSRQNLTLQMEQTRGMQLAFAQMQNDCENLASTSVMGTHAYLQAEDDRLTLVRMVLNENQPSRLQVVSYRLRDGVLLRRESQATRDLVQLDTLWQAALGDTDAAPTVALQGGVAGMSMRLWRNGNWSSVNGTQQQSQAQAAQAQAPLLVNNAASAVPTGLEVSLRLQGQEIPLVKALLLGAI